MKHVRRLANLLAIFVALFAGASVASSTKKLQHKPFHHDVPQGSHGFLSTPQAAAGHHETSPNGQKWAIAYTPYTAGGDCKTRSEVAHDLAVIAKKKYTTIRLYSSDCSLLSHIGPVARRHGLSLIPGVFIPPSGTNGAKEQIRDILEFGQWDLVEMIVIGNEALFNEYTTASDLAKFIKISTKKLRKEGYDGPITTSEAMSIIRRHAPVLCPHLDVLASNIHPFFDPNCDAANAGKVVFRQLEELSMVCGDRRPAYNLETGWPNNGTEANGLAVPGFAQQVIAIAAIKRVVGAKSAFFSFEDDAWKDPGAFGVEQFWGCMDLL